MIKPLIARMTLLPLLLTISPLLSAQDLTLFESVASEAPNGREDLAQGREQRNTASSPSFTLVGTTRIGSRHKATLATSAGEIVVVDTTPGVAQDIPDHPGFQVVDIGSRRVSIANPPDSPCVAAQDKGVSCGADGVSLLTLATAAPVVATPRVIVESADPAAAQEQPGDAPDNPFAAALRAAAQNEANNQAAGQQAGVVSERFQPRRIAPEDVPPGMRVVRTPFGDRLVEQ